MTRVDANFIWVGNPRTENTDDPEQDLMGPLSLNSEINLNTSRVNFWCLEKHTNYYRDKLKNTNIVVRSIESFVNEKKNSAPANQNDEKIKALAARVSNLINCILNTEGRGKIRDFFTVKEAFAFFLLASEGGWTLDTNNLFSRKYAQNKETKITLPTYPNFHMPAFQFPEHAESIPENELQHYVDVWAMFANKNNPDHSIAAANYYLDRVDRVDQLEEEERNFSGEKYDAEYKRKILHVVIQSAMLVDVANRDIGYIPAARLGSGFPVKVFAAEKGGILFEKEYHNTHSAQDRDPQSDLMKAVVLGHINEVRRILSEREDIDINIVSETDCYEKITLLSAAYFYGHHDIADLLKSHKADVSIEMKLKPKPLPRLASNPSILLPAAPPASPDFSSSSESSACGLTRQNSNSAS